MGPIATGKAWPAGAIALRSSISHLRDIIYHSGSEANMLRPLFARAVFESGATIAPGPPAT